MASKSNLTSSKAKMRLEEGRAKGKPLSKKQKKFFGMVAGGKKYSMPGPEAMFNR